jgi:hypothetical protein
MSGDWIKMRTDLRDDPAVFQIAASTGLDRFNVVGRLAAFWSWTDKHAVDGRVDGATFSVVDDVVSFAGFCDALKRVKWIDVDADGVYIPKHERHNIESGKERSLKSARQAKWRANKALKEAGNVDVTVDENVDVSLSTSPSTREEKRREESTSLRSVDSAGKPAARPKRVETTLQTYLDVCKAEGKRPLPPDHSIRAYCRDAGITDEMLQLAWITFKDRFTTDDKLKRQKDWPGHFANSVKSRWYRLWYLGENNSMCWTTEGLTAKKVAEARMKPQPDMILEA